MRTVQRTPAPCPQHQAFSLIELLVVVSIIAVLAAMLMPVIGMLRESALKTQCVSNLRQIGMIYGTYTNDWEGYLPDSNAGTYNLCYIAPALTDTYLDRTSKAWRCTTMQRALPKPTAWYGDAVFYHNWHITNRDMPPFGANDGSPITARMPVTLARIVDISEAMILADLNGGSSGGYHRSHSNMLTADLAYHDVADASRTDATSRAFSNTPRSVLGGWIANTTSWKVRGFSYRP